MVLAPSAREGMVRWSGLAVAIGGVLEVLRRALDPAFGSGYLLSLTPPEGRVEFAYTVLGLMGGIGSVLLAGGLASLYPLLTSSVRRGSVARVMATVGFVVALVAATASLIAAASAVGSSLVETGSSLNGIVSSLVGWCLPLAAVFLGLVASSGRMLGWWAILPVLVGIFMLPPVSQLAPSVGIAGFVGMMAGVGWLVFGALLLRSRGESDQWAVGEARP